MARKERLLFLDGLRGLAALYVVLFHEMTVNDGIPGELSQPLHAVHAWLHIGHYSVIFFIVLSGFSLTMPVAGSAERSLRGGFRTFIGRRARRIMPPYYAALAFSIAVLAVSNFAARRLHLGAPVEGALEPGSVLSHLFLVHNARFEWAYRINAPLWTIATEWQIYFVFALVLLPIWRRAGIVATVIFSWVLGALPYYVLPSQSNFFWACPWFLGSFALGMAGAVIEFSPTLDGSWLRERFPWTIAAWVTFALVVTAYWTFPYMAQEFTVSVFGVCLISACASLSRRPGSHPVVRWLCSRPVAALGTFSFSLYLIQHPILKLYEKGVLRRLHFGKNTELLFELLVITPLLLAVSWLFAEFFEKPFTTGSTLLPVLRRHFGLAPRAADPSNDAPRANQ